MTINVLDKNHSYQYNRLPSDGLYTTSSYSGDWVTIGDYELYMAPVPSYELTCISQIFDARNIFICGFKSSDEWVDILNAAFMDAISPLTSAPPFYSTHVNRIKVFENLFDEIKKYIPTTGSRVGHYYTHTNNPTFPVTISFKLTLSWDERTGCLNYQPMLDFFETCGYELFRWVKFENNAVYFEMNAFDPRASNVITAIDIGGLDYVSVQVHDNLDRHLINLMLGIQPEEPTTVQITEANLMDLIKG